MRNPFNNSSPRNHVVRLLFRYNHYRYFFRSGQKSPFVDCSSIPQPRCTAATATTTTTCSHCDRSPTDALWLALKPATGSDRPACQRADDADDNERRCRQRMERRTEENGWPTANEEHAEAPQPQQQPQCGDSVAVYVVSIVQYVSTSVFAKSVFLHAHPSDGVE